MVTTEVYLWLYLPVTRGPDLALSTGEGVQGDKIPGAW